MRLKRNHIDLTNGPLYRSMLIYAFPVFLGALISNLFHSADMIVLGNMASISAVSAVGVTGTPISLIVNTFIGLGTGVTIQLSRAVGAEDHDRVRRIVNTAILTAFFLGILVTALGFIFHRPILEMLSCPEDIFDDATLYMMIYFSAAPAILIYNFGASILRVHGDTERPLYYLIASGILNVVLNVVLCMCLERKVVAVAVATLASQILGAALVMIRLGRGEKGEMHFSLHHLSFDFGTLRRIMLLGLPGALNSSLFVLGNIPVTKTINSFGQTVIAGNNACVNIETLISAIPSAFSTAIVAFVGQNIGAQKPERVRKSYHFSLIISMATALVCALLIPMVGRTLLGLYVPETAAIEVGYLRMKYIIGFYFLQGIGTCAAALIQTFGKSSLVMGSTIFFTMIFRYLWVWFVFPSYNTVENIFVGLFVSWASKAIFMGAIASVLLYRYLKGKYKEL